MAVTRASVACITCASVGILAVLECEDTSLERVACVGRALQAVVACNARVLAASHLVAGIGGTLAAVVASDSGEHTTDCRVTGISGAGVVVVTECSNVDWSKNATRLSVAGVGSARVGVLANDGCENAATLGVACVSGASVVVIAGDGSVLATRSRDARISCAGILITANFVNVDGCVGANSLATDTRAGVIGAFVPIVTDGGTAIVIPTTHTDNTLVNSAAVGVVTM